MKMRYVKTVHLKEHLRPAQYFYSLQLVPFHKVSSKRLYIEGTIYNLWSFPKIKKKDYLAAFPLEKIDHFLVLEYTDPYQYLTLSSKKNYKLTDFKMETRRVEYIFDQWNYDERK